MHFIESLATVMVLFRIVSASFVLSNRKGVSFLTHRPQLSKQVVRMSTVTASEKKIMQDVLYRVRDVNRMPDKVRKNVLEFIVDGIVVGKVRPKTANLLCSVDEKNPVFSIEKAANEDSYLTLLPDAGKSAEERTKSVNRIMLGLRNQGIVTGWRDENYPVRKSFYDETLFGVERSAASLLGIMEYGVHINGIVTAQDGNPRMWMARRAADKSKYPGMLDHIVAGGQPVGLSLLENVIKECKEEAGIPEEITLAGLQAAGAISYETYSEKKDCITRCVLFCYDLHLPSDFVPKPVDGEVEEFFLWDVDQLKASMDPDYDDPIKPNCYSVIIDYLLRCGHLEPDTKGYLDVLRELRSGDCY